MMHWPSAATTQTLQTTHLNAQRPSVRKVAGTLPAGRVQPSCTQNYCLPLGTTDHVLAYRLDTHAQAKSATEGDCVTWTSQTAFCN